MQKSLLDIYLKKVANGDTLYLERLCYQLSDSVIYLPVSSLSEDEQHTTVLPIVWSNQEKQSIPVFTQYRFFDEWQNQKSLAISLKGGDLCAALTEECSVAIDPGTEHAVVLPPTIVRDLGMLTLREGGVEVIAESRVATEDKPPAPDTPLKPMANGK